jgi:hypothetical protein
MIVRQSNPCDCCPPLPLIVSRGGAQGEIQKSYSAWQMVRPVIRRCPLGRIVTPAFLALNKSPIKSRVNSKSDPPSSVITQTLAAVSLSLSPQRACRDSRRHRTSVAPLRTFPTSRSATGRESRARRGPASRSASPSPPPRKSRRRPGNWKKPHKTLP